MEVLTMGTLIAALISLIVTGGVVLAIVGFAMRRREVADMNERMAAFAMRPKRLEDLELSRPFFDRIIRPSLANAIKFMSRFTPKSNLERLQQNLEQAGNPNNWSPTDFMGVRGLSAVALCGATAGLMVL